MKNDETEESPDRDDEPSSHDQRGKFAEGNQCAKGKGRPKGTARDALFQRLLNEPAEGQGKGVTKEEAAYRAMMDLAITGNVGAWRALMEYRYGRPRQEKERFEGITLPEGADLKTSKGIVAANAEVLKQMFSGEIDTEQGSKLIQVLLSGFDVWRVGDLDPQVKAFVEWQKSQGKEKT